MLNVIWILFFLLSFAAACYQAFFGDNPLIWTELVNALFASAKSAFTIAINLTGMLCLWLGLLKIAEKSGITDMLARGLAPLFKKIMPEIPERHPAIGSMVMNIAANMLGLDNAATPMGLKAMEQMQQLNPHKDTASNAEIMFMVINASAVTIIPINILMYRAELGSANPCAVFIPILIATSASSLAGFLAVALVQKLPIFNRVVLAYLLGFAAFIGGLAYYFANLDDASRLTYSESAGNFILFLIIAAFIGFGAVKRLNVYETFITGAKEGFDIAVKIIPYLVAMLTAIAVLRASGVMDIFVLGIERLVTWFNADTGFVPALPTAFIKPLSGSGARAMMIETLQTYGADSFAGFVSSVIQGSTETTFYVLAVYFGAIKVVKIRHALPCALFADLIGIMTAIYVSYLFY